MRSDAQRRAGAMRSNAQRCAAMRNIAQRCATAPEETPVISTVMTWHGSFIREQDNNKGVLELMQSVFTGRSSFVVAALFAMVGCTDGDPTEEVGEVTQHTSGSGAVGKILANSSLGEAKIKASAGHADAKVKGLTTLIMQEITIQPGGHTGWHTHGGMAFASIVAGTLTLFAEDAPCVGTPYAAGTAFLDPGGGHVHIARNLGADPITVRVQYVLPNGAPVRIDAPAPAGAELCP